MFQRTKHSVHLPNRVINLEVESFKHKIKQNIWISRNMLPGLGSNKLINPLPHLLHNPKANKRDTSVVINSQKESRAMPAIVRLRKGRNVITHCSSTVVNFGGISRSLLDVNVLAEKVKPRAGAMSIGGAPKAVTDRLETFFGEVAGDVEDVEELDELGEGISTGKIKRCKSGVVSLCFFR